MKSLLLAVTTLLYFSAFTQDIITLKSGDEVKGKIIKVGVTEVEYKKDSASPVYAIEKSKVFMIKYENGSRDVLANLEAVEQKKPSIDPLQLKYLRSKKAGTGLLIADAVCIVLGPTLLSVGLTNLAKDQSSFSGNSSSRSTQYLEAQKTGTGCLVGGIIFSALIIPFTIAGAVNIRNYVKYKKQWKEQQRSLSFAPNGVRLNF